MTGAYHEHAQTIYAGYGLTPRERSVCDRLLTGAMNAEIAYELNIAESTVKNIMSDVHRKLGTDNRTQAALVIAGVIPAPNHVSGT